MDATEEVAAAMVGENPMTARQTYEKLSKQGSDLCILEVLRALFVLKGEGKVTSIELPKNTGGTLLTFKLCP